MNKGGEIGRLELKPQYLGENGVLTNEVHKGARHSWQQCAASPGSRV